MRSGRGRVTAGLAALVVVGTAPPALAATTGAAAAPVVALDPLVGAELGLVGIGVLLAVAGGTGLWLTRRRK